MGFFVVTKTPRPTVFITAALGDDDSAEFACAQSAIFA